VRDFYLNKERNEEANELGNRRRKKEKPSPENNRLAPAKGQLHDPTTYRRLKFGRLTLAVPYQRWS